jgi:hypothetical protein
MSSKKLRAIYLAFHLYDSLSENLSIDRQNISGRGFYHFICMIDRPGDALGSSWQLIASK